MAGFSGLVGLAVVKNEADIIEAMIRHNLQFLDALVVVDNASADQTAQIVGALVLVVYHLWVTEITGAGYTIIGIYCGV